MAAIPPDLSVTITQRRRACVLDPTLALTYRMILKALVSVESRQSWVTGKVPPLIDTQVSALVEHS